MVKVDPNVDLSLLGPLVCAIQTGSGTVFNKLKPKFGDTLAVYGCGLVGLSAVMVAEISGCAKIIAVDLFDSRLSLAKELGAIDVINGKERDTVQEVRKLTNGGTHYAMEITGVSIFSNLVHQLQQKGSMLIVSGLQDQPRAVLEKTGLAKKIKMFKQSREAVLYAEKFTLFHVPFQDTVLMLR
ncbi:zinc-binding dehydrogenase [Alkalihalobacillus sp. TS-13]|uniref:zinc-binding dehydrogenase n=1 Tax=Alkalihalobacillus sp. TS-13 TaxID=2842455 RepID=UPI001C884A46|nr:zinc-binding dehydrogenase [Alkalihalobacillus sp. TS-13]